MTDIELADEYYDSIPYRYADTENDYSSDIKQAYLAGRKSNSEVVVELEREVLRLTNENKILKQDKTNVFAELNDETAKSNEMLMDKVADFEKACDETQELLDKQIESTYKLHKENEELKEQIEEMKSCFFCKYKNSDYDEPPCSQCKWGFPSCSHTKYKDRWEFDKTLINNKEIKENDQ